MSVALNSTVGVRSGSMAADAHGSEPMAGDEFEDLVTQIPLEVGSVCGSNAMGSVASVVGLILLSLDGVACSGSRVRAVT